MNTEYTNYNPQTYFLFNCQIIVDCKDCFDGEATNMKFLYRRQHYKLNSQQQKMS